MSHWEPNVDLKKSGIKFAIFKLTEGTSYVDPTAAAYIKKAEAAGIPWGIYHFARGGSIAEAKHFLKHAKPYIGRGLLILDWEDSATQSWTGAAKKWLDYVAKQTGTTPWLYTYKATEQAYDWSAVAKKYPLWYARYNSTMGQPKHWKVPVMWQFTDRHALQGHRLDANYYYGTLSEWAEWAKARN